MLPFHTASADPEDQYRSDGLGETLVSRLSQLQRADSSLWVVPSSEVRQAGVVSAEAARRAFGVTLVITGSIQRLGDRLRVNASLVDAIGQKQLRAVGPTDFRLDDIALQDQIPDEVVRMLEVAPRRAGARGAPRRRHRASAAPTRCTSRRVATSSATSRRRASRGR